MNEIATRGRPWPAGVSGNPNGRPAGSRTAFSHAFLRDLAEVWAEHGKETMQHTARTSPETFFAVCSKLIPKDVQLTIEQTMPKGLEPEDLAILKAIKLALPNAGEREPGEVLQFVLDAVRAHEAKVIDATRCDTN
jgi:hypothetical protein